jgi:hypothetical protein
MLPIIVVIGCAKQADTNELVKSNLTKG